MKFLFSLILLSLSVNVFTQELRRESLNSGGQKSTSGTHVLKGTLGETSVGESSSASHTLYHGYWNGITAMTPPPDPSHPETFYISGNTKTSLTITFDSPSSTNNDAYLVLYLTGNTLTDMPADNNNYSVGSPIGSSTVGGVITDNSATTFTLTGLTMETTYTLRIIPYSGPSGLEDYLKAGDPATITATTIPTMGEWAMISFVTLLGFSGLYFIRKRV
ncbi:MAG: hypothetical protein Kapaf2KO_01590 [Candidatus Kapaibacteriales bacterium]